MRTCSVTGCEASHLAKGFCSRHYTRQLRNGDPAIRSLTRPTGDVCAAEGCDKPRWQHKRWCGSHAMRQWRYGDLESHARVAVPHVDRGGYTIIPTTSPAGYRDRRRGRRARVVLFEAIGDGVHACYWCSTPVDWGRTYPKHSDALTVDHVDFDPSNDAIENLVPSCVSCNVRRALRRRHENAG